MKEEKEPLIDSSKELTTNTSTELDEKAWVNEGSFAGMIRYATEMVKSKLIPFKTPQDAIMAWQFGRDIGLTFTQSMTELYAIPSNGVIRITAGVHIHEAILLKNNVRYYVVEDAIEVQHYKIKGLGTVILSMQEVMAKIDEGIYQLVTAEDFTEDGVLTAKKEARYFIMQIQPPYLAEGVADLRTTIRLIRKDKELDESVSYLLSDAAKAGYLSKDNWQKGLKQMLYTAGFRIISRRYCSDLLKNLGETSEVLHYSNIPYEVNDNGEIQFDTDYEEVIDEVKPVDTTVRLEVTEQIPLEVEELPQQDVEVKIVDKQ